MDIKKQNVVNDNLFSTLLWLLAIGFVLTIPMRGYMNNLGIKLSSFPLGFAILFMLVFVLYLLYKGQLICCIRRQKIIFSLSAITFLITTIKYIGDHLAGIATSIMSYYAIPTFMFTTLALTIWQQMDKRRKFILMQIYIISFSIIFIIYSKNYIIDGGAVRAVANFGNPNEMSIYSFASFYFAVILILSNRPYKIINALCASNAFVATYLSQSRTAMAALFGGGLIAIMLYLIHRPRLSNTQINHSARRNIIFRFLIKLTLFILVSYGLFTIYSPDLRTVTDVRGEYYTIEGRRHFVDAFPELRDVFDENGVLKSNALTNDTTRVEDFDFSHHDDEKFDGKIVGGQDRLLDGSNTNLSSLTSNLRFTIWQGYLNNSESFWQLGAENRFQSVRPVIDETTRAPHNTFLYLFVQYGILPFILFVLINIFLAKTFFLKKYKNGYSVTFAALFIGMLLFCLFNDLVEVPIYWLVLSIMLSNNIDTINTASRSIAIVRRNLGDGGIEQQIANIAIGLLNNGYEVTLITDSQSKMSEAIKNTGGQISIVCLGNPFIASIRIARLMKKDAISILQSHMFFESFICRLARGYSGDFFHVFRVHTYIDASRISTFKKYSYHFLSFMTDCFVDRYISINMFNVREMLQKSKIHSSKIGIVHDGISFQGDPFDNREIDPSSVVMLANYVEFKGHDILIEGIKALQNRGIKITAYIYGSCPRDKQGKIDKRILNNLRELAKNKNVDKLICFNMRSDDIRNVLIDKWALVLPSYMEGTPNCLLEAMSLKILTISARVGGIPEFIEDGVNGFLHAPGSPESFAEAIINARSINKIAEKNILNQGYTTWNKHYSVVNLIGGLLDEYDRLLASYYSNFHKRIIEA